MMINFPRWITTPVELWQRLPWAARFGGIIALAMVIGAWVF